ncbi:MAG: VWA domain-containing protein [Acidobacteriaceae bacterium]
MQLRPTNRKCALLFFLTVAGAVLPPRATAASCKTESQMTAAQRDLLSSTARAMAGEVQRGDVQALRANTIPAVAADFGGIAASAESLKPLLQHAAITVDDLYALDASGEPAGAPQTDFYCGTPIVVLNFTNLPPGKYALAILHATGVPQPQQISLIVSEASEGHWMLAGFFSNPMIEAGHNGLWYWTQAREYAQKKMHWNAWFYYRTAASLLNPAEFMSSPNLVKLQREADEIRPDDLPGVKPAMLDVHGSAFAMTAIHPTGALGGLDLEVHYTPDAAQLAQLQYPATARKQAIDVMTALLALHPELRVAFRGIWLRADQGNASVFALDLPMDQIAAGPQPAASVAPVAQTQPATPATAYDPTQPEVQPGLNVDRDPVPSPDAENIVPPGPASPAGTGQAGEIQKGKSGTYTLRENVNEVVLNCTVVDEKKQLVADLKRSDFRVWEDGVLQTIGSFQYQDLPVSMGILVDNSGSMRDKRAAVDAAALDLVRASNPADEAFIVNFSDKAYLDQDFTSNIGALERGLSHLDSQSTTALYDAVAVSADELTRKAKQPKQVLLIITDGADNASRLSLEQAVRSVQRLGGPAVYSIGLLFGDDKEESQRAETALETLSRETGGIAYFPHSLQDVDQIAGEVALDIRNQYTIGYHSTKPVSLGGYRTVRVEAKAPGHGKLIVRTLRGYYPRQAQHTQAAP